MKQSVRPGGRAIFFTVLIVIALAGVFAAAEHAFRAANRPGRDFNSYVFYNGLAVARWGFLNRHRDRLYGPEEINYEPNMDEMQEPEGEERPPFDRVPISHLLKTNADGYRDEPFEKQRAPGTLRLLLLGDSVGFGRGVEADQRFSDIVEKELSAAGPVEIMNLCVSGCTTRCMAQILSKYIDYDPDFVIIQVSANDYDLEMWRRNTVSLPNRIRFAALKLVSKSRLLLYASFKLRGNYYERETESVTRNSAYLAEMKNIFELLRRKGLKAVMISAPLATGVYYSAPAEEECRAAPDVCIGSTRADFSSPNDFISCRGSIVLENKYAGADWAALTADYLGLPRDSMDSILPYRSLYVDIVHPNEYGNLIIAKQLLNFLGENAEELMPGQSWQKTEPKCPESPGPDQ